MFFTACFVFIFFHTKIVFIKFEFSRFAFPPKHAWKNNNFGLAYSAVLKGKCIILYLVKLEWATVKASPTGLMLPSLKRMKQQHVDLFLAYSKAAWKSVLLRINESLVGVLVFHRNKIELFLWWFLRGTKYWRVRFHQSHKLLPREEIHGSSFKGGFRGRTQNWLGQRWVLQARS